MSENRYEITKLLGKGRTGGVYEAEDGNLNRKVAMRRFFDQGNIVDFSQHKEEFLQVAQSLSNLQHPNLLRVFDAGFDEDGAYIASQLLEGGSLHEETKKGAMDLDEVIEMAKQLLDAFSMTHDIDYFHGALTPDSILMVPRARGGYRYVILDMGLSRLAPLIQGRDSFLAVMADRAILSPELFDGGIADARADLYMLGQILFMCIAGGHPFGGLSVEEAKKRHLKGLPSIKKYNSDVSKKMVDWLSWLTAVIPEDRPASAVEALCSLQQISASELDTSAQRILSGMAPLPGSANIVVSDEGSELTANDEVTGPVPILPPGITQEDIPVASLPDPDIGKPVIAIAVGVGALFAIVAGVIFIMCRDSDDQDDVAPDYSTSESSSSDEKDTTNIDASNFEEEKGIVDLKVHDLLPTKLSEELAYFDGQSPDFKVWKQSWPSLQGPHESGFGWLIKDDKVNSFTGLKFPLIEHTNKMYDRGWSLSYKVYVGSGAHRVGFLLSDEMNPGWMGGGAVGCCVIVQTKDRKITFYSPKNNTYELSTSKSHVIDFIPGKEEIVTLSIHQAPAATSGEFIVKLDGKEIYVDTFTKEIKYEDDKNWRDHLFCSTLDKESTPSWIIKEIKLQTL